MTSCQYRSPRNSVLRGKVRRGGYVPSWACTGSFARPRGSATCCASSDPPSWSSVANIPTDVRRSLVRIHWGIGCPSVEGLLSNAGILMKAEGILGRS